MSPGPVGASTGATAPPRTGLSADDRAQRVRFRRALTLMLLTLVLPGSAQVVAGSERSRRITVRVWAVTIIVVATAVLISLLALAVAAVAGVTPREFVLRAATNTLLLAVLRWLLLVGAVGWAFLFVDAWRLGNPLTLHRHHRLTVVGVNAALCLAVAAPMLFGAHVVAVTRDSLVALAGNGVASGAHDGRYNVLLIGGDQGAGRWGMRADSINVASIDAETGKTLLISLPRNMQNFPFAEGSVMDEQFPQGFDEPDVYLNGLTTWAADHRQLFKGVDHPGVEATIQAVEGITDLRINYWAMVNLEGFKGLVDAVGGVELNVRQPIPVGLPHEKTFHYIEPGKRVLDGHDTLWFARAREGSDDYSRMARQKCVMSAMLTQLSPRTVVTNLSDIAEAGSELVSTDLPGKEMGRFIDLAMKAKSQKISTLSLVPPMINTADPDIELVHRKVAEAIDRVEGQAPARRRGPATGTAVTGGSVGSLSGGYAANESEDLGAVC